MVNQFDWFYCLINFNLVKEIKKKKPIARILIPIFSLLVTFLLLFLLYENIKAINNGDHSVKRYSFTIIESISLFIIPFIFNPKAVNKRLNKRSKSKLPKENDILELKIKRLVKLDGHYTPAIIKKCPKCGFVNTRKTKECYNCGYILSENKNKENFFL